MAKGSEAEENGVERPPVLPEETSQGAPDWVVTFADLMSLLLCFFVLLLSFSRLDNERFKELAGSLREAFGVQREIPAFDLPRGLDLISREFSPTFNAEIVERLRATVRRFDNAAGEGVNVKKDGRGIRITMDGELLFASVRSDLREDGKALLLALAPLIREVGGDVHIEGHTDNRPFRDRGQADRNWELSYARALAVLRVLEDAGGLPVERLVPIGRGPSKPVAPNLTAWGRRRNRRVELALFLDDRASRPKIEPGDALAGGGDGDAPAAKVITDALIPEVGFSGTERGRWQPAPLFPELP